MLNQLLKNIELPDRCKRAARSLQEIRQFSMTDQAGLNAGKCQNLCLTAIFCAFGMLKTMFSRKRFLNFFTVLEAKNVNISDKSTYFQCFQPYIST